MKEYSKNSPRVSSSPTRDKTDRKGEEEEEEEDEEEEKKENIDEEEEKKENIDEEEEEEYRGVQRNNRKQQFSWT